MKALYWIGAIVLSPFLVVGVIALFLLWLLDCITELIPRD